MKLKVYEDLKAEVLSCKKCDLGCKKVDNHDPHVMGQGNLDASIIFMAEAPGLQETIHERPLTPPGTSGRIYERVLKNIGLSRDEVYTTNTVLCRPENNNDPMPYQVHSCGDYLVNQFELIQPKLVVTFGRFAAQALLGYVKITKDHGQIRHSKKFNVDVFPMYHPAYVGAYANAERRLEFKVDTQILKKIVKEHKEAV